MSTQEQAVNGHSIDEQIDRMKKYCEAMGWKVYYVYTDAGYSGGDMDRPGLQKMIRDVKAGKLDKVLVYKLDRLSRSQKDTLTLIEDIFLANNTEFVSMSENFDTSTPFGRAMVGILAVFAQLEREQIKERMAMGKFARAKKGLFNGSSTIPVGYDYEAGDGTLSTNEFEKMQVVEAFQLAEQGKSPYAIAKIFNEKGYVKKHGKWDDRNVRRVLTSKTYVGYNIFQGEWYKGEHEAFVTDELFEKVQQIMAQRSEHHRQYNRRPGKATTYLGGFLVCKRCGAKYNKDNMRRRKADGTGYYVYEKYRCCSRAKRGRKNIKDPNCKNANWNVDDLQNQVFGEIRQLAVDPKYYDQIKAQKVEDERPKIISSELGKIDEKISRLMDLYTIGQMPMEMLQDKIHELNDQRGKLEAELEEINAENEKKLSQAETLEIVRSFSSILETGDFDSVRAVITDLIEYIEIDGDDLDIHWTFA